MLNFAVKALMSSTIQINLQSITNLSQLYHDNIRFVKIRSDINHITFVIHAGNCAKRKEISVYIT